MAEVPSVAEPVAPVNPLTGWWDGAVASVRGTAHHGADGGREISAPMADGGRPAVQRP